MRNGRLAFAAAVAAAAAAAVVVPLVALAAAGKEDFEKGLWQRRRECQFVAAAAADASDSVDAHTADTVGYTDTADGTVPVAAPAQG